MSGLIGIDASGNSNSWTVNNMSINDIVKDTPTNNFAIFNRVYKPYGTYNGSLVYSQGNLEYYHDGSSDDQLRGTLAVTSGKYYYEFCVTNNSAYGHWIGVSDTTARSNPSYDSVVWQLGTHSTDGGQIYKYINGTGTQLKAANSSNTAAVGDVCAVAFDADAGSVKFYKNNSLVYTATSITLDDWGIYSKAQGGSGRTFGLVLNAGQDSSFADNKTAQGNQDGNGIGDFYYTPPSGYLALCTANLPTPAVNPGENFNVKPYGGNNGNQSVSGVGFQPDIVWVKNRNTNAADMLADAVRGQYKMLEVMNPREELTYTGSLVSFNSDGFTIGSGFNSVANSYVSWNWKGGNGTSNNTDGTISSTVSANPSAGISIISYTGNGTAGATIGHGLNSAPEFIFAKYRSSSGFGYPAYHKDIGNSKAYFLHSTVIPFSASTYWNSTTPTSSVFSVGTSGNTNSSGGDYIAYAFHSVEGFSKIGSFIGNGSTNGVFVYTGFQPEFIILKNVDTERANPIMDFVRGGRNGNTKSLFTHSYQPEQTHLVDYLSNGFKLRTSDQNFNESGDQFLYIAFAEHPLKYGNAQ